MLIRFFLKVGQCSQVPFKIHGAQKWDSAYKFSEGYTVLYIVRISFLGVIAHKFLKDVLSAHQFLIEGAKCSQVH